MAFRSGFWRLWVATIASNLGDGLVVAAFPLLAATITSSPTAVAGVTVAAGAPWLLFGLFAGALMDRHDRRRWMVGIDLSRAAVVGVMAISVATAHTSLWALYAVVFFIGLGETIADTAAQAILPALVDAPELDRANGWTFAAQTVAQRFIGPPLGGALFVLAAAVPIAMDATSFLIAALVVASIHGRFRPVRPSGETARGIGAETAEGLRWLWNHGPIRAFAIGAAVLNIAIVAGEAVLVLFAQQILGLKGAGFGLLIAATAVGYTAGSGFAPRVVSRVDRRTVVVAAVIAVAVSLLVTAMGLVVPTILGLALIGVASGLWDVIAVSYRQAAVPDTMLGRIMSAYRFVAYGAFPVGALVGGVLAALAGLRAPFIFGGALSLLLAPFLWRAFVEVDLDPAAGANR